jgi:hypothetical protein
MGNPNCCFMIIAGIFFSPANRRGELWGRMEIANKWQTFFLFCICLGYFSEK